MNTKSPSSLLFDFLTEIVSAADEDMVAGGQIVLPNALPPTVPMLRGAEVLDSAYQIITQDKGIVVSNSEWDFAPTGAETDIFDALLILGFYYRIPGADTTERASARDNCFLLAKAVADALYQGDQDLGGRVCRGFLLLRATDGDKSTTSDAYAVINLPIILNPSGARIDYNLGEAK